MAIKPTSKRKKKKHEPTNQKHNTVTHKQQCIKEKLMLQNTRYIQIGQNIQEPATSPSKKDTFQMKNIKKNPLINYYTIQKWPNYYTYNSRSDKNIHMQQKPPYK